MNELWEISDATGWSTLSRLQEVAWSIGCSTPGFDETIETVGDDPYQVASYLQRLLSPRRITQ